MNVKLRVLSAGAMFFLGQAIYAQNTGRDTLDREKQIEAITITGYRPTTEKTTTSAVVKIDEKTIENRPNPNVLNTIQGQLAGVNIASGSGQPGAKPTVIIRGVGTLNGNTDPLYVIDGFPSNSDSFRTLNSNDIASMEVLKDASAISEYGARGANGVIVIKTKSGKYNQGLKFRYSTNFLVSSQQDNKYNYSDSRQLLTLEKRYGIGRGFGLTDDQINNYDINTNWRKVFFQTAIGQTHDFSITSGGENINSYTSVGYLDQEGVLRSTGLKRFSLRNNINGKSSNSKFNYSLNSGIAYSKNNLATNLGTADVNQNFVVGAMSAVPYVSPSEYQNYKQLFDLYSADGTLLYTPLMLLDKLQNFETNLGETRVDLATQASYKISDDFTAMVRTSGQYLATTTLQAQYPYSFNSLLFIGNNQFGGSETNSVQRQFLFNNLYQLRYNKKFLDKHTIGLAANGEYNFSQLDFNSIRRNGLDPKTYVPGAGTGYVADTSTDDVYVPVTSNYMLRYNMISYFGSLDYDFDKKFGVSGTVRTDGTSRFNTGRQWGTFWSVGARVNLESLLSNSNISLLKLRGSYGTVGNQRIVDGSVFDGINPPLFYDVYGVGNNVYGPNRGYSISFGYPELRWETTRIADLGVDFDFFKRLSGSLEFYNKKTEDQFIDVPVSSPVGTSAIRQNSTADVTNKGIELNLKYDIIKRDDWQLSIRGNGAYNNQKVSGIPGLGEIKSGNYNTANGGKISEYYVYRYAGVNQGNGNLLFYDKNGSLTETPTDNDRVMTGKNFLPEYQGGFGFDVSYKGFYASTTFTFVANIWRFDFDYAGLMDPTSLGSFNASSDLLNAWTPSNTNTTVPSLTAANLGLDGNSDRFIVDASYLRLRNVQLGYTLPQTILKGTFINNLSVYVQGENLFTVSKWRGWDPESNRAGDQNQYPTPRIFTLGLDVKF
ncbi:SusC/RagA family TonB-linked outer membrane protein [Chryseobacterium zhengzhouense]|uniref:SusC/RagA family TonB-linked outer membrane protein n=1 Tax=Chryseobacterium zhengzhouense TaxID=1636086 RepID=A0ABW2LVT4_9FLAO